MGTARNFREYPVWKDSVSFSTKIYEITSGMPLDERRGLCSQMQRAAVSIASNIAEGCSRSSSNDFTRFLEIALGSAYELETQLIISFNVNYITKELLEELNATIQSIEKQISALIGSIKYEK